MKITMSFSSKRLIFFRVAIFCYLICYFNTECFIVDRPLDSWSSVSGVIEADLKRPALNNVKVGLKWHWFFTSGFYKKADVKMKFIRIISFKRFSFCTGSQLHIKDEVRSNGDVILVTTRTKKWTTWCYDVDESNNTINTSLTCCQ